MESKSNRAKCKKYCSIAGAHLIMEPMSFLWVYGNLSEYMESYFRFACAPYCMDGNIDWITGLCFSMVCPGTLASKYAVDKIGLKWTGVIAAVVLNAAMFGSAWTLQRSSVWTILLLGPVLGFLRGVSPVVAYQSVVAWVPKRAQIFISTVSSSGALIAAVQNEIVTWVVNPRNLKPNVILGPKAYFSQREVLDRVPTALLTYAAINTGFQFVGYLLLTQPQNVDSTLGESNLNKVPATVDHSRLQEVKENVITDTSISKPMNGSDIPRSIYNLDHMGYGSTIKEETESSGIAPSTIITNSFIENSNSPRRNNFTEESPTSTYTNKSQKSLKPAEVLKTPVFYAVFLYGVANAFALALKVNFYKQFGLLYIHNDDYLTLVGTVNPVFGTLARAVCGILINQKLFSVKDLIVFCTSVTAILCSFWYFVPQVNAVLYLFFIVLLATTTSLYLMIFATVCLQLFGPDHFSTNYGLLLASIFVMGLLEPVVVRPLMVTLGWELLFASAGISSAIALGIVICTDFTRK